MWEMKIMTTMSYHYTSIRTVNFFKKIVIILNADKDAKKLSFSYTVGGSVKSRSHSRK